MKLNLCVAFLSVYLVIVPYYNTKFIGEVYCHTIEMNAYGVEKDVRVALIFRDITGEIIDWRMHNPQMKFHRNHLMFSETGKDRVVKFKVLYKTRTIHDVEVHEREKLPDEYRRKLFPNNQ
jgi:hypothetical protein